MDLSALLIVPIDSPLGADVMVKTVGAVQGGLFGLPALLSVGNDSPRGVGVGALTLGAVQVEGLAESAPPDMGCGVQ